MSRGDKSKYTDKQKRQAEHIEQGYLADGVSRKEAESRAWATVNKQDGGGKKPGGSAYGQASKKTAQKKAVSSSNKKQSVGRKTARRRARA